MGKAGSAHLPWLALILGATGIAVLVSLGLWQLHRLAWKEDLLASITERIHAPPRALVEVERRYDESGDVDYWPVEVEGTFVHSGERHFLATHDGQSGFFVYTPLMLADDRYVLVNRGFVPYDRKDASTRLAGQVLGKVHVTGLARNPLSAKPSFLVPDNDVAKNVFYWKDREAMAASAGLDTAKVAKFFIDADEAPNPGGLPVGGVTIVDLPNNHLQYAVTWFGLAAALGGILGGSAWRRAGPRRRSPP